MREKTKNSRLVYLGAAMLVAVALTGCSGQKSASGGTGTEAVPGPETSLPSENMELVQPEVEFASYFIRLFTKKSGPPFGGPFHGRGETGRRAYGET